MTPTERSSLTTTSYAILGQLSMRPWTMYELARHMRDEVAAFFPRAESQVYAEPKRLVSLGLVDWRSEATGRRKRTVYHITEGGRDELSRWLARPPTRAPLLEFEGLLRVFLSGAGRVEDLRQTIASIRDEAAQMSASAEAQRSAFLDGTTEFQDQAAERALVHDFLHRFALMIEDWAAQTQQRLDDWPEPGSDDRDAAALEAFRTQTSRSA